MGSKRSHASVGVRGYKSFHILKDSNTTMQSAYACFLWARSIHTRVIMKAELTNFKFFKIHIFHRYYNIQKN